MDSLFEVTLDMNLNFSCLKGENDPNDIRHKTIYHPVHIKNNDGSLSKSSFIPFCDFGGNTSAVGVKIEEFDIPVCNSFQAKILHDQLCYEVDLNKFSNKSNIKRDLKIGFSFLMDYNEDRQTIAYQNPISKSGNSFAMRVLASKAKDLQASIYLDTIGNIKKSGV